MKKGLFIILFVFVTLGLSAQKEVRKAIRMGNKSYNEQLYATAEAEYSNAKEGNANSKEAAFNLANTYYKQQKWDEALAEYQHYLKLENEDPGKISAAWSNMGNTFLKKVANSKSDLKKGGVGAGFLQSQGQSANNASGDDLKLSMEAYKNALRFNPNDEETRYNLAVVQKMIKDREDQKQDEDKKDDQKQDQKQDQQDQKQDQKQDPKQDPKQDQQQQNQMSQDNIQQILQALEQDEKETQERVRQAQARERKEKNEQNRRQNKDW